MKIIKRHSLDFVFNKSFLLSVLLVLFTLVCNAQNWDINLLKDINLNRNRSFDELFKIITDYAPPVAYTVPFFLLGLSFILKDTALHAKSTFLIGSAIVALAISEFLKHTVNRPRPFVTYHFINKITSATSPSFPSGHTCDAFTLAVSLCLAFPRWYVIVPAISWACSVGYSRMDLGVHYPTDIIGSIVVAALSSYACFIYYKKREQAVLKAAKAKIIESSSN